MKPALQKILFEIEPRWFCIDDPVISAMCFGFECKDGWFQILADMLVALKKVAGPDFAIVMATETFGALRLSVLGASQEAMRLVKDTERKSRETCEWCGRPGTMDERFLWRITLCPECQERRALTDTSARRS